MKINLLQRNIKKNPGYLQYNIYNVQNTFQNYLTYEKKENITHSQEKKQSIDITLR